MHVHACLHARQAEMGVTSPPDDTHVQLHQHAHMCAYPGATRTRPSPCFVTLLSYSRLRGCPVLCKSTQPSTGACSVKHAAAGTAAGHVRHSSGPRSTQQRATSYAAGANLTCPCPWGVLQAGSCCGVLMRCPPCRQRSSPAQSVRTHSCSKHAHMFVCVCVCVCACVCM